MKKKTKKNKKKKIKLKKRSKRAASKKRKITKLSENLQKIRILLQKQQFLRVSGFCIKPALLLLVFY